MFFFLFFFFFCGIGSSLLSFVIRAILLAFFLSFSPSEMIGDISQVPDFFDILGGKSHAELSIHPECSAVQCSGPSICEKKKG